MAVDEGSSADLHASRCARPEPPRAALCDILQASDEQLHECGLSHAKTLALRDLADRVDRSVRSQVELALVTYLISAGSLL